MDPYWKPDVIVGIDFGMTSKYAVFALGAGAYLVQVLVSHTQQDQNGLDLKLSNTGRAHLETALQIRSIQCLPTTSEVVAF